MPFLQLIPAKTIKATYYARTRSLVLNAAGEVRNFTGGISFRADAGEGGELVYGLFGWVGPLEGGTESTRAYGYSQTFAQLDYPGLAVLIKDANHPQGVRVPVEIVAIQPAAADLAAAATQAVKNVKVGGTLALQSIASVGIRGSVTMAFDEAFLGLESAGVSNAGSGPEIGWQLKGLKAGESAVKITFAPGGLLDYITVRTIRVVITP